MLYRIIVQTSKSLFFDDENISWQTGVLYCGYDRDEARKAYHSSKPLDGGLGLLYNLRRTICEIIDDANTTNFDDDKITSTLP